MSVLGKNWLIKNTDPSRSIFEKLLKNRNFQNLDEKSEFHDPFLFSDMEKAVKRIGLAIKNKERIIVFGDYDVDGITASAILLHILNRLKAVVSYRLPNRVEDGYGLNEKFIDQFIEKNIKLLITVDCGISCFNEVAKAHQNGIDVIITDHHTVPQKLPGAYAILHPKQDDCGYPFNELTGAGVALKLAHALIQRYLPPEDQEQFLSSLLDLACLGTVADLGVLTGENRLIVQEGLKILKNTRWKGLRRLKEVARISETDSIDTTRVGFQITPRINAAGRIATPYIALQLLLENDDQSKINSLALKLEKLNRERQSMTEKALEEAEAQLLTNTSNSPVLIDFSANWHVGILGLVASKLVEKYHKPAIVMQDLGDNMVASARSPEYFNIIEAITNSREHLISFGGHAQAAGFNIRKENYSKFKEHISAYSQLKISNLEIKSSLEIDCEILDEKVDFELIEEIEKLAPFGPGNRKPAFLIRNLVPQFVDQVGEKRTHLKFSTIFNDKTYPVIAFRMGHFMENVKQNQQMDLVFHLERNVYKGQESVQLHALDFSLDRQPLQ